jgi:hypothetical protein
MFKVLWMSQMAVNKSALADDFVKSTRLRKTGSFVFRIRLSGIYASWYRTWHAMIFRTQCRPSDGFKKVKYRLRTMKIWADLNA